MGAISSARAAAEMAAVEVTEAPRAYLAAVEPPTATRVVAKLGVAIAAEVVAAEPAEPVEAELMVMGPRA